MNLVNNKLKTPKAYQVQWVVDWLNHKGSKKMPPLRVCKSNTILNDAWLAGFIDGDGSFAVRRTTKQTGVKNLVECQMLLVQRSTYKKTNQSYQPVFQRIADALKTNVTIVRPRSLGAGEQYQIKVASYQSKTILRRYLNKYPLLTSKILDYQCWCGVDDIMLAKQHYTAPGDRQIQALKSQMNRSRTVFVWDHLNRYL